MFFFTSHWQSGTATFRAKGFNFCLKNFHLKQEFKPSDYLTGFTNQPKAAVPWSSIGTNEDKKIVLLWDRTTDLYLEHDGESLCVSSELKWAEHSF